MRVNFISSKDRGEICTIYVWSNNENIMWCNETCYWKTFWIFLDNYQKEEQYIKGSDFVFESVELMDYKLHKVNLKRGRSYVKSPKWLANKGATINPKNIDDDKCFQYSVTLSLNYNEIKKKELENIF